MALPLPSHSIVQAIPFDNQIYSFKIGSRSKQVLLDWIWSALCTGYGNWGVGHLLVRTNFI